MEDSEMQFKVKTRAFEYFIFLYFLIDMISARLIGDIFLLFTFYIHRSINPGSCRAILIMQCWKMFIRPTRPQFYPSVRRFRFAQNSDIKLRILVIFTSFGYHLARLTKFNAKPNALDLLTLKQAVCICGTCLTSLGIKLS